jgi:Tol biopolymer transport system component
MPRDRSATCGILALITISVTLSHCGQGEDLTGPDPAVLVITTQTSGTGTDPDGYTLSIDGHQPVPIALVDTLFENGATPGEHTVDLGGIASGCTVEEGSLRSVTAVSGTIDSVNFSVTCTAPVVPSGTVIIAVSTSGVELDRDGYLVAIDPSYRRAVGVSDQVSIEGVAAGRQVVGLSGLADNCSVQGENPVTIDVPQGGQADAAFVVRCWSTSSGKIAFVTSSSVEVVTPAGVPLQSFAFEAVPSSWSPDGQFLALVIGSSVMIQPLAGGPAVELPGCLPSGHRLVWSPDGRRLLCLSVEGRLSSVQRDGSSSRLLSPQNGTRVISASFFPDGRLFLFAEVQGGGFEVLRAAADGSEMMRLFTLPHEIGSSEQSVVLSPDGQKVAYKLGDFPTNLYVARIDGTNAQVIASSFDDIESPIWSPDGNRIAFLVFPLPPIADVIGSDLWLVNPDGAALIRAPVGEFGVGTANWSSDGDHLVFDYGPAGLGVPSDIFTIRAEGRGLQRLTASGDAGGPAWGR